MIGVPSSPRARRRLAWLAVPVVLLLVGIGFALLLPQPHHFSAAPTVDEGPAQLAADTPRVKLTAADRRAIDHTLDVFIPAGMLRTDPAAAWRLAGPEYRSASSLDQWRHGNSPVPYYPLRERTFHHWETIDVEPGSVIINLLLHPKPGSNAAPTVFSGQVVKVGHEWRVNRLYAISIENKLTRTTHEIGPADFAAQGPGSAATDKGRIGHSGLLPVVSILALVLLIPLSLGLLAFHRHRRWKRLVAASGRQELPPLPSRYLSSGAEDPEPQEALSQR